MFEIEPDIKIIVNEFKGKKYIDIRKYYLDEDEMKPTKKGISFNEQQWDEFSSKFQDIQNFVKEKLNEFKK